MESVRCEILELVTLLKGEAGAIPQLPSPEIWSKVTNCVLPVMLFDCDLAFLEDSSKPEFINSCHKSELLGLGLRLAFFLYCKQQPL